MSTVSTAETRQAKLPIVVEEGQARPSHVFRFLGETIVVKFSATDTGGRFVIVEETTPPMSGPPLHQHSREDEWFYVIDGEYRFQIGAQMVFVGAGDMLFAPLGMPHTFQNISKSPSRLLALTQPTGIEGFFAEMVTACAAGQPDPAELLPIFHRYGLELLGPPLGVL